MATELCKRFRERTDKPHIFLCVWSKERAAILSTSETTEETWMFCDRVNPVFYKTPGDAARAWHNYKAPGA